eukprot:symbB.v1.2.002399.t1/scaffold125.1/size314497/15
MGATSGRLRFDIRSQLTSPVVRQFLRSAEVLGQSGRALRIVAYEVSAEALRSFHIQAQREGMSATESKCGEDDHCHLPSLEGRNLQLEP